MKMESEVNETGKLSGQDKQAAEAPRKDPQGPVETGDADQAVIQDVIALLEKRWSQSKWSSLFQWNKSPKS